MQTFTVALALAALANALPSEHARRGHSHHRRAAAPEPVPAAEPGYDLAGVDWTKIDWASVFAQKGAAPATTATAPAAATTPSSQTAAAVTPVTSKAAAATTTPASSTSSKSLSGGKRGLAWDQGHSASMAGLFEGTSLSWTYNWGMGPSFKSAMEYVWEVRTASELGALGSITQGATLLGFNEPDQAGMSASEAAGYYHSQITPLRKSGKIGYLTTPGVTNGGGGLPWLQEFMAQCSDCAIDAINVHWYGPSMDLLQSQIAAVHAAFPNYPIWISEVGCTNWNPATNPSPAQVAAFLPAAAAYFESSSFIARWAWFGALKITDASLGPANMLVTDDLSSLSALGQVYTS